MANKLRKIFCPTPEERQEFVDLIKRLHDENIGHCGTCKHLIQDNELPGFVSSYGECALKAECFYDKVSGLKDIECPFYEESHNEEFGI